MHKSRIAGTLFALLALANAADIPERQFRGKVVCLPEEMHRLHQTDLPTRHEHVWGFRTEDGSYYTLLRTKLSEAIFLDEPVRKRELVVKARLLPKSQILDVVLINSLVNKEVHKLYYWCEICAIESVSPAECACCQGPVELREERE